MKVVLQRVKRASVRVAGETVGTIGEGLVLLVGIKKGDKAEDVEYVAEKIARLRVFSDHNGKMNDSVCDRSGAVLSVSQFTLYADSRKGRRPDFGQAAAADEAEKLYRLFNKRLREKGLHVETGRFGKMMEVELVNDGPVTLIVESP